MGRLAKNVALGLASVALTLAITELAVRLLVGPVPPRNMTVVPASLRAPAPFDGVPFVLAPDAQAVHDFGSNPRGYFDGDGQLTYRTNALGWRSPPARRTKPAGTFRILGLGDSFTFGTGVRSEDVFLSVLRDALAAERPGRYEIWNLGVMGYDTSHEVALLRHVGIALDPDLVVICYVLNDAEVIVPKAQRQPGGIAGALGEEPIFGARHDGPRSLLLDHLRARLRNRRVRELAIERTLGQYAPRAPGWLRTQRALGEAAALAREHGFALALMIFPSMWQLDDGYPFAEVHAKVAAAARAAGIPVLDLLEAFRGRDGVALWVHPSNQHPNEEAHAVAGRALHRFLRERGLLPG